MQRRFIRIIAVFIAAAAAAIRSYADERDSTRHDRIDESVVISVRESKQLEGVMSGRLRLDGANISGLPKFLGTTDILKTIQLLPGVMASGEMDSGIYITLEVLHAACLKTFTADGGTISGTVFPVPGMVPPSCH